MYTHISCIYLVNVTPVCYLRLNSPVLYCSDTPSRMTNGLCAPNCTSTQPDPPRAGVLLGAPPHLGLLQHGHLLLQGDVLLLQLRVVLQQPRLPELVLLDVIPQPDPLQLIHLVALEGGGGGGGGEEERRRLSEVCFSISPE